VLPYELLEVVMSAAAATLQDATRAVQALEQEFAHNANAANLTVLADAYYAGDAQLLPPGFPPIQGIAAIREFWTGFLAAGCSEVELRTSSVSADGDLAWSTGAYGYTQAGVRRTGKYLVVYRRQADGAYRSVADAFSENS
jgi:ketosteroid isomerase-like protein